MGLLPRPHIFSFWKTLGWEASDDFVYVNSWVCGRWYPSHLSGACGPVRLSDLSKATRWSAAGAEFESRTSSTRTCAPNRLSAAAPRGRRMSGDHQR